MKKRRKTMEKRKKNPTVGKILKYAKQTFDPNEIKPRDLEAAVMKLSSTHQSLELLPELVQLFVESQDESLHFSAVLDFCNAVSELYYPGLKKLHKLYSPLSETDVRNLGVLEFLDLMENTYDTKQLIGELSSLTQRYPLPQNTWMDVFSLPLSSLSQYQILLRTHWSKGDNITKDVYRWLFERQEETGSFRDWLEAQPFTKKIRKDFKKFGLDYDAWDDPSLAFGYKRGRLEQIVFSEEDMREEALEFARRFMKGGDFTGYLTRKPGLVWKEIEPAYKRLEKVETDELGRVATDLLEALSLSVKPQSLKKKNNKLSKEFRRLQELVDEQSPEALFDKYTLTYRVWRRQPSLDFCEGNDSGVCVAFGGENPLAIPHYLLDKTVCLVDILHKGRRYGQIFLVAMYEEDSNTPILLVDSLEASRGRDFTRVAGKFYGSAEQVINNIAERAGFPIVFTQSSVAWAHSTRYLDHITNRFNEFYHSGTKSTSRRYISGPLYLSKICGTEPIRVLKQLPFVHTGSRAGQRHYFDAFGGWREYLTDHRVRGISNEVK